MQATDKVGRIEGDLIYICTRPYINHCYNVLLVVFRNTVRFIRLFNFYRNFNLKRTIKKTNPLHYADFSRRSFIIKYTRQTTHDQSPVEFSCDSDADDSINTSVQRTFRISTIDFNRKKTKSIIIDYPLLCEYSCVSRIVQLQVKLINPYRLDPEMQRNN